MFFNQAFGGGGAGGPGGPGLGGSSSAFTTPGMSPQVLAQLMAMGGAPGAMGGSPGAMMLQPQLPPPPGGAPGGQNATPSGFPAPPQIPQGNMQQQMQQAMQGMNPEMIKRLLAMLQGGAAAGQPGNMNGLGGMAPANIGGIPYSGFSN